MRQFRFTVRASAMTIAAALIALDAIADGAFAEVEALVDGDAESLVLYRDGAQVRS